LAQRRGICVVVAGLPQIGSLESYLTEIASISLTEFGTAICQAAKFLNALPDRSTFCAFSR
jgi:hypothetical protein